ncbi:MAG: radical SAM protein [Alphaproteobacteria bacterium]|jgi:hypothetical protein|nr:radical SAM protein [Alphaproteobacteria bacterium]
MPAALPLPDPALDPNKFQNPSHTAKGDPRAHVALRALDTLWFNTGTLCNLTCEQCYIESSPRNDRLAYITTDEVRGYLDEIAALELPTSEIGFTGGEPFMNPDLLDSVEMCLEQGFRVLILTNAMRPMMKCAERLQPMAARWGDRLTLRVSLDHFGSALHEHERGPRSWQPTVDGLTWLADNGFSIAIAGRLRWGESEAQMRQGYRRLFGELNLNIDADDPAALMLFPEMDETADVPEISIYCWNHLGIDPHDMMCAHSRMVVKAKGHTPQVMACTLLAYDPGFAMGASLAEASGEVSLNHPHCARFCVLGGGSCSAV